jgi:hypothetical protein
MMNTRPASSSRARTLSRSFSCSTFSPFPSPSLSSPSSSDRNDYFDDAHSPLASASTTAEYPRRSNSASTTTSGASGSLVLRRMSTFARFLRGGSSNGSNQSLDRSHSANAALNNGQGKHGMAKLRHGAGGASKNGKGAKGTGNVPPGPEWVSSPRDFTSCTLCDRFFVSGEDWLEVRHTPHHPILFDFCTYYFVSDSRLQHYGQCYEERADGAKAGLDGSKKSNALASASNAKEPYCIPCDQYFLTTSSYYHVSTSISNFHHLYRSLNA